MCRIQDFILSVWSGGDADYIAMDAEKLKEKYKLDGSDFE